jgi:predicted Zn-dependent protease
MGHHHGGWWGGGFGNYWGWYGYYGGGGYAWSILNLINSLGYGYRYGYGGYGCGYAYNPYCSYGGYGGYASPGYYLYSAPYYGTDQASADPNALTVTAAPNGTTNTASAATFADDGEAAFKAGDFKQAEYALRHAVVDDPKNPVLVMMLSQALFANGKYDEAAGATQNAMQQLPKDQWGVVVTNYKDLYSNNQSYTDQLRALEKAAKDKPDSPALHFLLGFHYGYLGYPRDAVIELDKTIKLAPRDEMAKQLREEMQNKLPKTSSL